MKIGNAAIGKLARMICGDAPYNEIFPYRSSSYLTSFFEELDLDYVHDGSTRFWWVRSVLEELNEESEASTSLPSDNLIRVIEYLVDPDQFDSINGLDQNVAVEKINECLRRYELTIQIDKQTGNVDLCSSSGEFISTAIMRPKNNKTITFSPSVFSIPELKQDNTLVSVMMPFSAEFTSVYKTIQQACKDTCLNCYRADDIWEESTFMQDIFNLIFRASIVIVDFTGRNPNVMYETGISHALGKNVIPITQHIGDIPSDLKPHRALKYLSNSQGLEILRKELASRLYTLHQRQDATRII